MDFIPERSEHQVDNLELKDSVVRQMVKDIGLRKLIPGRQPASGGISPTGAARSRVVGAGAIVELSLE